MRLNLDHQSIKNVVELGRHSTAEKGLYLIVKPSGHKYWIFRYSNILGRHDMSLGPYPSISVAEVRKRLQEARLTIIQGDDPIQQKKVRKTALLEEKRTDITFETFALDVINAKRIEWTNSKHAAQWLYSLERYAFPVIGKKRLDKIEMDDILKILTPIWETKTETASRLRGRLEWILAAATTKKLRSGMNPALWRGLLQTVLAAPKRFKKTNHHRALPYRAMPEFMNKLREMDGIGALALEFLILNANRTSEVTDAKKEEIMEGVWVIPGYRMKARKEHRVPLCARSLEIIAIANMHDPASQYIFSNQGRKLSNMAMSMVLRRMQIDITVHGFRSTFRDWAAEETSHPFEVAEMALAHRIRNQTEASYRRGDLLARRHKLMMDWESYCNSNVVSNVIDLKAA